MSSITRVCAAALRRQPADGVQESYGAFDELAGDAVNVRSRIRVDGGDGRRKGVRRGRDFAGGFREGAARGYRRREGRQEAQRNKLWGADGAFQCGMGWWKWPDWVQSRRYALSLIGMRRELVGRVHVRRGVI